MKRVCLAILFLIGFSQNYNNSWKVDSEELNSVQEQIRETRIKVEKLEQEKQSKKILCQLKLRGNMPIEADSVLAGMSAFEVANRMIDSAFDSYDNEIKKTPYIFLLIARGIILVVIFTVICR